MLGALVFTISSLGTCAISSLIWGRYGASPRLRETVAPSHANSRILLLLTQLPTDRARSSAPSEALRLFRTVTRHRKSKPIHVCQCVCSSDVYRSTKSVTQLENLERLGLRPAAKGVGFESDGDCWLVELERGNNKCLATVIGTDLSLISMRVEKRVCVENWRAGCPPESFGLPF